MPTENQIFMACLDAHLYEIEYKTSFLLLITHNILYAIHDVLA
jgi:hypothetical protein